LERATLAERYDAIIIGALLGDAADGRATTLPMRKCTQAPPTFYHQL
jgi:hypothetical protein